MCNFKVVSLYVWSRFAQPLKFLILLFQAEDSVDDDVLNSFCWMYSSFDMPATFQFPCARKKFDGTYLYNTYYQWVPVFLAFNAGVFYIPRCIWLIIEGGLMSYMVKGEIMKSFKHFCRVHKCTNETLRRNNDWPTSKNASFC